MLDKLEAKVIVEDFFSSSLSSEEWYINVKPHVKASVLYGSVAKGLNKESSDIDVLLFIPLAIEEKYTKGEYFYVFNHKEINIVLRSIERLRIIAAENTDKFQKEVFRDSLIIYESDGEVRRLLSILKSP